MSGVSALIPVLDFARVEVDQEAVLPIPKSVELICLEFYRSTHAFSPALHWNNITTPVPIALSGVIMIVSPR